MVHVLFVDDISPCTLKGHGIAAFCAAGADCWGRDGVDGMCAGTQLGDGIAGAESAVESEVWKSWRGWAVVLCRFPLELFSISETSSVSWSEVRLYERTPSTLL